MLSNLPPGCNDADIPGCTSEDHLIDKAVEAKQCEACRHYFKPLTDGFPCDDCHVEGTGLGDHFDKEDDEAAVFDRLKAAEEPREDGHCDG